MESLDKAIAALREFADAESTLLEVAANERSITHKMAEYLQRAFAGWDVDCEYNRLGYAVKYLPHPETTTTDDEEGRTIFPDIIVHRRLSDENELVIEVKKTTNNRAGDEDKLKGLTGLEGQYRYKLGLHVYVDCAERRIASITAYTNGGLNEALTAEAMAKLVA